MRTFLLIPAIVLVALAACDSAKNPTAANFTSAINQYLANHGQACLALDSQFPIDIPISAQHGATAQLAALQRAGLIDVTDTTAVVQSLTNSLSLSPRKPEPVKRYTVSTEGQKYLQTVMTGVGRTNGFCYGQKQVDSIVKWTEPVKVGSSSQTEVTYTYKIVNLASWAKRTDVQRISPDIQATVTGMSTKTEVAALQLTSNGWEVPGR